MKNLKIILSLVVLISIIGFLDATYLTVRHYDASSINCSIVSGCEEVTTSRYSTIGGIPVALFGAVYYVTILVLAVAYFDTKSKIFLKFIGYFSFLGFLTSLILVFLQIFVIKAICLYCMVSAASSTMLFVLGILLLKTLRVRSDALFPNRRESNVTN